MFISIRNLIAVACLLVQNELEFPHSQVLICILIQKVLYKKVVGISALQLYQLTSTESETQPVFFPLDLHIYWGTFYGGRKNPSSFDGQKGYLTLFIYSVASFLRMCPFLAPSVKHLAFLLCIKILDRKLLCFGTHVFKGKYWNRWKYGFISALEWDWGMNYGFNIFNTCCVWLLWIIQISIQSNEMKSTIHIHSFILRYFPSVSNWFNIDYSAKFISWTEWAFMKLLAWIIWLYGKIVTLSIGICPTIDMIYVFERSIDKTYVK